MAESQQRNSQQQNEDTPLWEKAIGVVGMLFLVAIVGFLVYEAMQPVTPPDVTIATERILPVAGGYLVELQATNAGESTAAAVEVEGTLKPSDDPQAAPVETSSITIDYIPSQSTRRGGLFFQEDPNQYILEVQAKGYVEP